MGNSSANIKYNNITNDKMNYPNKINNSGNLGNSKPNIEKANKVVKKVDKSNIATNHNNRNIDKNSPHKLGQKPNSIKTFEENLKKKQKRMKK